MDNVITNKYNNLVGNNMGKLQIRVDDSLKELASEVFEQRGLDLSSAIRMFLKKTIIENDIPFDTSISKEEKKKLDIALSIKQLQKQSEENGLSDMTLDEINQIIQEYRKEKKNKK